MTISVCRWSPRARGGTGTFTASSCGAMHMELRPNAESRCMGYTDLMYDLARLTAPASPCPTGIPD
jgi:hypothetical protein